MKFGILGFAAGLLFGLSIMHYYPFLVQTSDKVVSHGKTEALELEKDRWKMMTGKWYGRQPMEKNGLKEWLVECYANGNYQITFKITKEKHGKKKVKTSIEYGEWGVAGPVYFSIYKGYKENDQLHTADLTDPRNRDAYEILSLSETRFNYRHYGSGNDYTIIKVPDDFELESDEEDDTINGVEIETTPL